ncbi:hypothetical protein CQW23_02933 [Capsicum baccatum]|uniref:F-box associated beta-propeller type 3 domain-containing protein n=1 Tax=Capsicum baccatum TaxID=33114 RepID=A0A2G2XSX6_CAPBA|nr:hypothetical protein CQW23_02933 [Capsicum baccatum]
MEFQFHDGGECVLMVVVAVMMVVMVLMMVSGLCNRPILLSCPEFNTPVKWGMDIPVEDYPMLRLIGSCNGFIGLMTNIYDINTSVYISNPLLGEYFKLKLPQLEKSDYGVVYRFCFSEASRKYKLVRSVTRRFGGHHEVSELVVYTLGVDEKWRNLGQVTYPVQEIACHRPKYEWL